MAIVLCVIPFTRKIIDKEARLLYWNTFVDSKRISAYQNFFTVDNDFDSLTININEKDFEKILATRDSALNEGILLNRFNQYVSR